MTFSIRPSSRFFRFIGISFLVVGLGILIRIYAPLVSQEVNYQINTARQDPVDSASPIQAEIVPPDPDFSVYIPKISALAPVVANVDPNDSNVYQRQLTKGIAHAKGSAYPGDTGQVFLFAHSAGNPLEASRFNAVFYLLSKLEVGDEIHVWYAGNRYTYQVSETKLVPASNIEYLSAESGPEPTLVLMTCWPPGTTLKRLLVISRLNVLTPTLVPEITQ